MRLLKRGNQTINGLPVYKPEAYDSLLGKDKTQRLLDNFAGGMLQGYQVRPVGDVSKYGMQNKAGGLDGQMLQPIKPSGVYDPVAGDATADDSAGGERGRFDALQMMKMNDAINQGTFGKGARPDLSNYFERAEGGGYNIRQDDDGNEMLADWMTPPSTGEVAPDDMTADDQVNFWARRLRQMDGRA